MERSISPEVLTWTRAHFPALSREDGGVPRIHLDNPAGTQVPRSVAEAMVEVLFEANANLGGAFRTSQAVERVVTAARQAMADFLHAASPDEIVFGQNMTSLTFQLSRALGQQFREGDEIVLSRMDHDANVTPWVRLAQDRGLKLRWWEFDRERFRFDTDQLGLLLNKRTRMVCVGAASNLTGTLNPVKEACAMAREVGAWSFIDGVQSAPHVLTDVQDMECDFFVCSAYKFFGPHQGVLWGRMNRLKALRPYKVMPAPDEPPGAFETGTQSHEGMAGTAAAVDYLASLGEHWGAVQSEGEVETRRQRLSRTIKGLVDYEQALSWRLIEGLKRMKGVRIIGIDREEAMRHRVPTVSCTVEGHQPSQIAASLAERNVFVWSGHNYAVQPVRYLGLEEKGGVLRIGMAHYNTPQEIDGVLELLQELLEGK